MFQISHYSSQTSQGQKTTNLN